MSKSRNPHRRLIMCLPVLSGAILLFASAGWSQDAYRIESYHYNPVGKIDPFKPLVKAEIAKKSSSARLTPLQQYDISQLKLAGIAGTGKKRFAMIVDKKGKSYIVSPGTLIGQNSGKVAYILDDQIVVEEKIQDSKRTKTNRLTLKLHRYEDKP